MSTEALVLALTTVVRPTSAAAVVAMLSTRHPQRLLVAYILGGLAFSLAIGTLVVVLLGGLHVTRASTAVRPLLDLVLGACALGYAAGAATGWLLPQSRPAGAAAEQDGWVRGRLKNLSPRGAAAAGVLTHLPGLVYLAALNAIVATATGIVSGVLQVVVYNAIWFSLAIVALVLSVHRPTMARELLEQIASWTRRHLRVIIVGLFGALGSYLIVVGVLGLAGAAS
jgi:Sap-like sulfolipid-1-addressing protein